MKEIRNATSQHQHTVKRYFGKSFSLIYVSQNLMNNRIILDQTGFQNSANFSTIFCRQ